MSANDLGKLSAFVLFAVVVYVAGFLCGMAREQNTWQRAAVENRAAIWEKNEYTGEWIFNWTPAPPKEAK